MGKLTTLTVMTPPTVQQRLEAEIDAITAIVERDYPSVLTEAAPTVDINGLYATDEQPGTDYAPSEVSGTAWRQMQPSTMTPAEAQEFIEQQTELAFEALAPSPVQPIGVRP